MLGFLFRRGPTRGEWLNLRIRWITEGSLLPDQQSVRAGVVAGELLPGDFEWIPSLLSLEFSPPDSLRDQFSGFCSWADARFDSIFLMLRAAGAPAMPVLHHIVRGAYDWPQGMALGLLAELAAQGIELQASADLVAKNLKFWRYETIMRGMNGICRLAACNDQVAEALLELAADWGSDDPIEELQILEPLSVFAPRVAARRESALTELMGKTGRGVPREPVREGFVVNEAGEVSGDVPEVSGLTEDYQAIRAALALQRTYPDRLELRAQLEHWRDHHRDQAVRSQLAEVLLVRPSSSGLSSERINGE